VETLDGKTERELLIQTSDLSFQQLFFRGVCKLRTKRGFPWGNGD